MASTFQQNAPVEPVHKEGGPSPTPPATPSPSPTTPDPGSGGGGGGGEPKSFFTGLENDPPSQSPGGGTPNPNNPASGAQTIQQMFEKSVSDVLSKQFGEPNTEEGKAGWNELKSMKSGEIAKMLIDQGGLKTIQDPATVQELTELRTWKGEHEPKLGRLEELELVAAAHDYESSDDYKATHGKPLETLEAKIGEFSKAYGLSDEDAKKAMGLTGAALSKFLESKLESDRHINQMESLLTERQVARQAAKKAVDDFRANSGDVQERLKTVRAQREATERKAAVQKASTAFEQTVSELTTGDKADPFFGSSEGQEVLGAVRQELQKGTLPVTEQLPGLSAKAKAYDVLIAKFPSLVEQLKAARAEIKKLGGTDPGAPQGGPTTPGTNRSDPRQSPAYAGSKSTFGTVGG